MNQRVDATGLAPDDLQQGVTYRLDCEGAAGTQVSIPFRLAASISDATDGVHLRNPAKLAVLQNLGPYPSVRMLADREALQDRLDSLGEPLEKIFAAARGVYVFGAHKVGAKIARLCLERKLVVKGFIDNDAGKHGKDIDGIAIHAPDRVEVGADDVVIVGSGHYSNVILTQVAGLGWKNVLNMHQAFFALRAPHGAESDFRRFSLALLDDGWRLLSAFLELDDEHSRKVFDGLLQMRITLDTKVADDFKSPFKEEYLDDGFIRSDDMAHYVDAGAFTGDTLERIEARFGKVGRASMFEPELPAYYEAMRKFAQRKEVLFYNFGLGREPGKFTYQPEWSCDLLNEIHNEIPNDITTFIQVIRLDDIVQGQVSYFKLDIEGAEESALDGAAATIVEWHPKLCVCAYHRSDDLWRLVAKVSSIDTGYRVGLRHYADIIEDTSLYFY